MEIEKDDGCCKSPQTIYKLRVTWDILKIIFAFLNIISLIAFLLWYFQIQIGRFESSNWKYALTYSTCFVFIQLGIVGIIHGAYHLCSSAHVCGCDDNANTCIYYGGNDCLCSDCGDCGDYRGDYRGDVDSDAPGAIVMCLMVIAVVLMAVGVIYSLIVSCALIAKWSQRHYAALNAKLMTKEYVVKDLQEYTRTQILKLRNEQVLQKENENQLEPSAPPSCQEPKFKQQKTITIM